MRHRRRRSPRVIATLGAALPGGCFLIHARRTQQSVSVAEIVRLGQAHVAPEDIVARMRASGTICRPSAAQLAQLHDEGVPDAVIDKMQRMVTRLARPRRRRGGVRSAAAVIAAQAMNLDVLPTVER